MRSETNRWLVLVLVCIAQFMVILDATIVNVALPSIQHGLHFSATSLQWIVNAYALVFGGFLLLGGRASDLLGRQRLFIAGVVVFTVASLINGIATSSGMLIGGRALQGLGAALVSPAALSIVTTTFAEGRERTKALGIWSAIAAGGGAFGLIIGGLLTETLSWRWVFFVNLPIGIAAALLSLRFIPNTRSEEKPETADVAGAVTVTGGLLLLVYAIVKAQSYGWGDVKTIGLFAAAVALLASFVVIELRSKSPLIRLSIFRLRSLTTSNISMLLVASGMFSMFYFASIYVQEILGYYPLKAGFAFLPFTFGIVIGAGAAQSLIGRLGIRAVTIAGLTIATIGLALFTQISVHGTYWSEIFAGVAVMSIGMGLTFVPLTLLATTNVANEDAGLASGIFNTSQQIGGALGLAVLSTLAASRTSSLTADGVGHAEALTRGFHVAFAVGAAFLAAGLVVLLIGIRKRHVESIDAAVDGKLVAELAA
ncbi:MAG: drug resistance transporter, EmrB/QacA subfamily [Myxococcales bacterium]|nr:drug resistance transporter, EmrB/QacA subfamily [Myxococcales bacterium]